MQEYVYLEEMNPCHFKDAVCVYDGKSERGVQTNWYITKKKEQRTKKVSALIHVFKSEIYVSVPDHDIFF